MRLVRQEGPWGCGIACIAMVTGWSYRDVSALFPDKVEQKEGLSQWELMQAFAWFGYALRIFGIGKYRFWPIEGNGLADHSDASHLRALKHRDWPTLNDAPATLVTVRAAEGGLHVVVMTSDGAVYDPILDAPTTIDTYVEVIWAAGVYPVAPRMAPESH